MIKLGLKRIQLLLVLLLMSACFCLSATATETLKQAQDELSHIAQVIKELQIRLKKSSADQHCFFSSEFVTL